MDVLSGGEKQRIAVSFHNNDFSCSFLIYFCIFCRSFVDGSSVLSPSTIRYFG